jgi:hypothetical protein
MSGQPIILTDNLRVAAVAVPNRHDGVSSFVGKKVVQLWSQAETRKRY